MIDRSRVAAFVTGAGIALAVLGKAVNDFFVRDVRELYPHQREDQS